jgi:hypothetical protein
MNIVCDMMIYDTTGHRFSQGAFASFGFQDRQKPQAVKNQKTA